MKSYRSLDDIMAEADQRRRDHPWRSRWNGLGYRLKAAWTALRREPRHRYERARYGASYKDVWGFDVYIAGVIAHACDRLKAGHSYPNEMTPETWADYLDSISGPLRRWNQVMRGELGLDVGVDGEIAAYNDAVAAMHRFADKFGSFWD